jgi:SAM-dependent methyltransferase
MAALRRRLRARLGLESREEAWERSRTRWRSARPTSALTWGAEVSGDAFVAKAEQHGVFGPGRAVLEVGPGYGRLLTSCIERDVAFASWMGIDISPDNVAYLNERFRRDGVRFVCADVETMALDEPVDSVISSLTFKHLFPSFEPALRNLAGHLRPGGVVVFDLIEGERRYFEDDDVTYIRWYTRPEVEGILPAAGLERVAFDEVRHHPDITRLLVIARKPEPT